MIKCLPYALRALRPVNPARPAGIAALSFQILFGQFTFGQAAFAEDSWRDALQARGITLGLTEQSEIWTNFAGGVRRGVTYNGLTTGTIDADLEKLAGLTKTRFYASVFQIHGREPSLNMVGTLQPVSNIEATRATRLYNAWVETLLLDDRLSLRIGQQGANDEMMMGQQSAFLLNSSFGYPALAAANLPSGGPNYPLATPMVRAKYKLTDEFTLVGAVFNGDPAGPGVGDPQKRNRTGTSFRVTDPPLYFLELWWDQNQGEGAKGLPRTLKLGAWHHSGAFADQRFDTTGGLLALTGGPPRMHKGDTAIYGLIDQMLWLRPGTRDQGIGVFALLMGAPDDRNLVNLYAEWGVTFKAPFASRPNDVTGLAFTMLRTSSSARSYYQDGFAAAKGLMPIKPYELSVEYSYSYKYADWLSIQPSLQYVINPGAGLPQATLANQQRNLHNSWTFGIRSTLTF
ncbi:carbohydrate porin [Roseiarcaceae bacterium H3SJ34-1]|uniref:carbohydrate porin n=1 Tax=Terripilifer ovatus TaxID=3032367 RepID=UPI003AB94907|nr:carbohydrate porin [Roseiarcaceae bacterium H3SJ34-1]